MSQTLVLDPETVTSLVAIGVMIIVIFGMLVVGLVMQMQMPNGREVGTVHGAEDDEEDISRRICCVCLTPPDHKDTRVRMETC